MFRRLTLMRTMRTLLCAALAVVCLVPLHAQKLLQPVATVVDFTGQVSVLDGDGGLQTALSVGRVVKQAQVIVTGPDGWAKFQYTDGSTFEIFPKSKVVFQQHPADWEHLLNIWIGHVKVWIQHAPGVPNYKNVQTPTAVISVRGTVFSVDVQDDDTTVVSVEEGLVSVRNVTAVAGRIPELQAGDSVTVLRGVPLAMNIRNNNNLKYAKALRAFEQLMYQWIGQRRGNVGLAGGGPGGTIGGSQGDKGKPTGTGTGTGTGNGAPTPPTAPKPPPAPPSGGH